MEFGGLRHPYYLECTQDWYKWRMCYNGGSTFRDHYLQQFSKREDPADFAKRKLISYSPSFAKVAVDEVKNSIFQRMVDIVRTGGPKTYREVIDGKNGGVDRRGNSMNGFLGFRVLPELLSMGKVAIYLDKPPKRGPDIASNLGLRPYAYIYTAEEILCWDYDDSYNLCNILLQDTTFEYDEKTGFPIGYTTCYRRMWLNENGRVMVEYHGKDVESQPIELNLTKIPVVILELSTSLMKDIADYQIALLNLASSDMSFALNANHTFYTEQYDFNQRMTSEFLRMSDSDADKDEDSTTGGTEKSARKASDEEVQVGTMRGRLYGKNLDRPGFIHPSTEPMKASMDKQDQLKSEIRLMLSLTIMNLNPVRASDTSKVADDRSLENGLSYIGLELEYAERCIAELWGLYENEEPAFVRYPTNYRLRSDDERRDEASKSIDLIPRLPTLTGKKELAKEAMRTLLETKVPSETLDVIYSEIDKLENVVCDPATIIQHIESGQVSKELASKLSGYPEGEADKAEKEFVDRAAQISIAQGMGKTDPNQGTPSQGTPRQGDPGARGVSDLSIDPKASQKEKIGKPKRGNGKKNLGRNN